MPSAAARLAAFLVMRALLKASLCHVAIDLRAANLRAAADQVDGRFLATLERAEHFVNHAIIDEGLQAGGCFQKAKPWIRERCPLDEVEGYWRERSTIPAVCKLSY